MFFLTFSLIWLFAFTFFEKGTSVSTLSASHAKDGDDVDDNDEMQIVTYIFRIFSSLLYFFFFFLFSSETRLREFYMLYLCVHVAFSKLLSVANSRGYLCIARIAQLLANLKCVIDFIILCVCVLDTWEMSTQSRKWNECKTKTKERNAIKYSRHVQERSCRAPAASGEINIYLLFGGLNNSPTYLFSHYSALHLMRVRPICRLLLLMLLSLLIRSLATSTIIIICILKWKCMRSFYEWDPHERIEWTTRMWRYCRHVSRKRVGIYSLLLRQMQPTATRSNIWFCYSQSHTVSALSVLLFPNFVSIWMHYSTGILDNLFNCIQTAPASHIAFGMRRLIIDAYSNAEQKSIRNENSKQKTVPNSHSYSTFDLRFSPFAFLLCICLRWKVK